MEHFQEQNERKLSIVSGSNCADLTKPRKSCEFLKSIFISKCDVVEDAGGKFEAATFTFCQGYKISFDLRFKTFSQRKLPKNPANCGNHSDCYKNWLYSVCDIW